VFDAFKPSLSLPHCPAAPAPKKMEMPMMSSEFAFNNGLRGPWLPSSGDDIALVAPSADGLAAGDWNEWMQWDPALSQTGDAKTLNAQGPVCMRKPDQRSPLFSRRQNSQLRDVSLALQPDTIPASASLDQMNNVPFSFGGDVQNHPAFDFDATTLSSPSSGGGPQPTGFYAPPMWEQQDPRGNLMFPASGFEQTSFSPSHAPPASTPSLHHSPSSINNERTSSSSATSSPEPVLSNPKKRKTSDSEGSEGAPASKKDKQPPVKKTAHNMIEKRYRTNLNDKIAALRDSVPSLRVMSRVNGGNEEDDDPEDLEGLTPAHKLNKATVLSKATEYIRHLEKRNRRLQDEVNTLKGRLDSYEKMSISGQLALHGPVRTPDGTRYHEDPFAHAASMVPQQMSAPQGLIPVPESMANLHRGHPPQPHYAPQPAGYPSYSGPVRQSVHGPPLVNGPRGSGMLGKLMVGSLAGLMILEGLAEREPSADEPAGRGLFALPLHLGGILAPRVSFGAGSAQLPLAKVLLVFGAFFYLIAPLLNFKAKPKKKSTSAVQLSRVPSLASPVEVRRTAWLTAIQTVWVPGHSFWLEVAALGLKTLKLSARKIIGWHGYALLTGITKDQEAARVKAWNIALDAQLTGGDAEISKSRLILTLMASGTLPDTPARLMLKALHIRILLWEFSNNSNGGWQILDNLSAMWARSYWNAARSEQKIAVNMASKPNSEAEPLPAHLAALLDLDSDEVLVPCIIQRAYNLAWNRPSAENTALHESMDSVVGDFSICSPLDALAAWWSCHVLMRALAACLTSKHCGPNEDAKKDFEIASATAPPTSQAHLRALVARAVVVDEDRSRNIARALEALPPSASTSSPLDAQTPTNKMLMNLIGDVPVATDIRKALTLAKCLALVNCGNTEARRRAIFVVNNTTLPEATTTLLSFVAGYKLLNYFIQDPLLRTEASSGLERLACSLRMWIGHETGRRSRLSNRVRGRIVGHCLDATKSLVGLAEPDEVDDGYVSSSVKGD
jgi:hypothetical protein